MSIFAGFSASTLESFDVLNVTMSQTRSEDASNALTHRASFK